MQLNKSQARAGMYFSLLISLTFLILAYPMLGGMERPWFVMIVSTLYALCSVGHLVNTALGKNVERTWMFRLLSTPMELALLYIFWQTGHPIAATLVIADIFTDYV